MFAYGPAGAGWIPIAGDWNGDGYDSVGLYNPATSKFYLRNTTSLQGPTDLGYADAVFAYGAAGAGWVAHRRRLGWRWQRHHRPLQPGHVQVLPAEQHLVAGPGDLGYADVVFAYGAAGAGWKPIAGDWDGDG